MIPTPRLGEWRLDGSPPVPPEEIDTWIRHYKATGCQEARNRVVESHLRLVAKYAKRYATRGAAFDDLMAEGAIALMRAVDNFDLTRGVAFTSYAAAVVEHAMRGAFTRGRAIIRVPGSERRRVSARHRVENEFFLEHGRRPHPGEVERTGAVRTGVSSATLPATGQPVLLGGSRDDDAPQAADILVDGGASPAEQIETRDMARRVEDALRHLPPLTAAALRMRFGLDGQPQLSAGEIMDRLNVSPRRLETMLADAMRRLRASVRVDPQGPRHFGAAG